MACINTPSGQEEPARQTTDVLLDISVVIHMVRPIKAQTDFEYVTQHIVPYLKSHITTTVERIDAVWDTYPDGNDNNNNNVTFI